MKEEKNIISLEILMCGKKTDSKNVSVTKANKGRLLILSKCTVCDSKQSKFIKEQEDSGLLTSLTGVKSPFQGISLLGSIV